MIGKVIGDKYVLLEKIGQGGSGSVYLARDLRLGKQWAVKMLGMGKKQEGDVLKSLEHSMIPRVVDCLEEQGKMWLVMDHISGKNLLEMYGSGNVPRNKGLDLALDLCRVLSYLHGLRPPYVHGDLKPENLIVTPEGKLFLVDFGAGAGRYRGICEGTPGYAAPEQTDGIATCCSDIYSFGKTWSFLLGRRAGRDWKRVLEKCCQPSPRKRYQKVEELERQLKNMKRRQESRRIVFLLSGALAVCAAVGYSAGSRLPGDRPPDVCKAEVQAVYGEAGPAKSRSGQEGECGRELGELAEALGRAAGIKEGAFRQQQLRRAVRGLERFYKGAPPQEWRLRSGLLLAWGYRKMGDTAGAGALYQELLGSYPDAGECYGSYGCLLLETGADEKRLKELYEAGEQMALDKEGHNYRIWAERMEKTEG